MLDLLRSQAICKSRDSLIQDSFNIKRALFFAPKPQSELEMANRVENLLLYNPSQYRDRPFPAWTIYGEIDLGDKVARFRPLSPWRERPDPTHVASPTSSWR